MYLIINETNEITTCDKITQGLLDTADSGILDIINISGLQPTQYYSGGWYGINRYTEEGKMNG